MPITDSEPFQLTLWLANYMPSALTKACVPDYLQERSRLLCL